jgi:hypothetical protein
MAMCGNCAELEIKIQRYRALSKWFDDPLTLAALKAISERLLAERKALHSDEE